MIFRNADQYSAGGTILREEVIDLAGKKIDCYVVSVAVPNLGTRTWWIAKETSYVVRQDLHGESIVFVSVGLNERIPDELFQLNAPPGAKKLDAQ